MDIAVNPGLAFLRQLVDAAGWHGSHRSLSEAAPHLAQDFTADDFVETLKNLGVPISVSIGRQQDVAQSDCPALFIDQSNNISAILDRRPSELLVAHLGFDGSEWVSAMPGRGTLIKLERFGRSTQTERVESFKAITVGFRKLWPWLVVASFMANLMGLATPLLIMMIYDRVIPTGSVDLVVSLMLAAFLVLAADAGFRVARSRAVAYMGRVVEHRLGLALFRKLMSLPLNQIKKSDVEQQLARFKQFEGLRDIFPGQIFTTILDLPFIIIFLALIFALAPKVGFLVLGLTIVFALTIWATLPVQQSLNADAAAAKARQQSFLFETVNQQGNIHRLGLGDVWRKRYTVFAEEASQSSRIAKRFQLVCQSFFQSLMTIAGVGAIVLGTLSAMNGEMSFGALIAVMSLVWKVLTPLQSLASNASQVIGFLKSKKQVDRVLSLPEESYRGAALTHQTAFEGRITLAGVTVRFPDASDPKLSQVSLDIAPGEFVVISGGNGSGKTTLAEVILGLHQPLVGSVQLDGIDLRQIPVDDLRQSFSYAQKNPDVFHGSLLQNMRLAAPTAHLEEIEKAIEAVGLKEEIERFPDGLNTRLTETYRRTLSPATSRALVLARSLVRPASTYIFNEPTTGLDYIRKAALYSHLMQLKGTRTIIIVTDDPMYFDCADRCIYLEHGRIVSNDIGANGRKKLVALISANKDKIL